MDGQQKVSSILMQPFYLFVHVYVPGCTERGRWSPPSAVSAQSRLAFSTGTNDQYRPANRSHRPPLIQRSCIV